MCFFLKSNLDKVSHKNLGPNWFVDFLSDGSILQVFKDLGTGPETTNDIDVATVFNKDEANDPETLIHPL